jgi:hypothetical protein
MATVANRASVTAGAPNLSTNPFGRTSFDDAGEIPSRDTRQRRLFHPAGHVLDVAWVDRNSHDSYHCRLIVGRRRGHLRQFKDRGFAKDLERYRTHDGQHTRLQTPRYG